MPFRMDAIRASYRIVQATSVHARALASDVGPDPPLSALGEVGQPRRIEGAAASSPDDREEAQPGGDELARRRAARELWARDMATLVARVGPPAADEPPPAFTYRIGPDGRPYATGDPGTHGVHDRDGEPEIRGPTEADARADEIVVVTDDARARGDPWGAEDGDVLAACDPPIAPRADVVRHAYAHADVQGAVTEVDVMA